MQGLSDKEKLTPLLDSSDSLPSPELPPDTTPVSKPDAPAPLRAPLKAPLKALTSARRRSRLHALLSEMRSFNNQLLVASSSANGVPFGGTLPCFLTTASGSSFTRLSSVERNDEVALFAPCCTGWLSSEPPTSVKSDEELPHPATRVERFFLLVEIPFLMTLRCLQCSFSRSMSCFPPLTTVGGNEQQVYFFSAGFRFLLVAFCGALISRFIITRSPLFILRTFIQWSCAVAACLGVLCCVVLKGADVDPTLFSVFSKTVITALPPNTQPSMTATQLHPVFDASLLYLLGSIYVEGASTLHTFPWLMLSTGKKLWNRQPRATRVAAATIHDDWILQPLRNSHWAEELGAEHAHNNSHCSTLMRSFISALLCANNNDRRPSQWIARRRWGVFNDGSLFIATGCASDEYLRHSAEGGGAAATNQPADAASSIDTSHAATLMRQCESLMKHEKDSFSSNTPSECYRHSAASDKGDVSIKGLDCWLVTPAYKGCCITRLLAFRSSHLAPELVAGTNVDLYNVSRALAERRLLRWMKDLSALKNCIALCSTISNSLEALSVFHLGPPSILHPISKCELKDSEEAQPTRATAAQAQPTREAAAVCI